MEWIEQLNEAIKYIEDSLSREIEIKKAAQIAGCSTYHFQRMFSYIAGVPLAEYIRRRRMTQAAFDLCNGDKVLDVAYRYQYESPTSFNRAFQGVHGFPPSAAKQQGVTLKAYPRISLKMVIKGEAEMEYRIEKKEAFRIVGMKESLSKELEENFREVPQMWAKASQTGILEKLAGMMNQEVKGILGVSACLEEDNWCYYIGVATDQPAIEGTEEYMVPAATWAVFFGTGTMPDSIQDIEKRAVTEWLPTSGYEYGNAPDIELYLSPDPANAVFEVWMPVVKK